MAYGKSLNWAKSATKLFTFRISTRFVTSIATASTNKAAISWHRYKMTFSRRHGRFLYVYHGLPFLTLCSSYSKHTRGCATRSYNGGREVLYNDPECYPSRIPSCLPWGPRYNGRWRVVTTFRAFDRRMTRIVIIVALSLISRIPASKSSLTFCTWFCIVNNVCTAMLRGMISIRHFVVCTCRAIPFC